MMEDPESFLGYRPQKELIYNRLLPYSESLYKESQLYLAEIKANLGNAILLREIIPEALHWTNQLAKYIRVYGRLFPKEDHLYFIKLLFEILMIPDLEMSAVQKIAYTLNVLIKKTYLLTRDDLVLPWRPLYELFEKILYSPYEHLGMFLLPGNLETTLKILIRSCRQYFSVDSTQEMLDEWRPLVCPFDVTMSKAMTYFELFLCTSLPPQHHDKGFRLWFEEFMNIWNACHNGSSWENSLVWLFSRLARSNIGYVNWEPHIPMIFTRLLRSFNLPGGTNKVNVTRTNSNFDTIATVNWIASMLGGGSCCQVHISRLFKSLESYYHPSNSGRWIIRLQRLIHKLPVAVVKRLHKERYKKPTWETPVPQEYKLTEAEITTFVESLKNVALLAMFSKTGSTDSAVALQNLSILRPEIVILPVLERLYSSLETLTEPHRLTAAMHCVVSVARGIVQGKKFFPEGPSHVVPLLMGALPGIDPNDIKKCMVTFQFISTFTTLILLVDCSNAVNVNPDLTEEQRALCLSTAAFEDFVLEFMDRCFMLIENSSLEHPSRLDRDTERMNAEENILEVGLSSTFSSILTQSSPEIYKSALRKLYTFVSSHILEIRVSGKYAANMCRSTARVNPELALQTFVPYFCKLALALTDSEDIAKEEKLDDELLFCLLSLSEVVRCDGAHLLKYCSQIEQVLQRTLHLKCREGYYLSGALLRHTLRAFTLVYPLDFRSVANLWADDDVKDDPSVFIKDWGKCGDVHNLGMKFHVPTDEEIAASQKLLETFLIPELDRLNAWVNKEKTFTREEIQCTLSIVLDCLLGASGSLPLWPGDYLPLKSSLSKIPLYCPHIQEIGSRVINIQNGKNVRLLIIEVMRKVLDCFLKSCEDDTKSLFLIIRIYHNLMFHWGLAKEDFDTRWKGFHIVKRALENKLTGRKQHIRALLVDRTFLQHEMRLLEQNKGYFTEQHANLMQDLLKLSISHYSEVRSRAQHVLHTCIRSYHHSYNVILPELIEQLNKDPTTCHEEFKGALYIILGHKQNSLLTVRNWELLQQLWPVVVSAKYSEKPSIIKLIDQTSTTIQKYLETAQIKITVPSRLLELARDLWDSKHVSPSFPRISDAVFLEAETNLQQRNAENEKRYYTLVESLIDLIENGNLHWRHYHLALAMLCMSIRYDTRFPDRAVNLFVRHLVHDTLNVRKMSITAMCAILKQQKRPHLLREVNPQECELNQIPLHPILEKNIQKRPDNLWLQYNSLAAPSTQELWDKRYFVHKTHVGFYSWPKPFKVYCPDEDQPLLDRTREQLSLEEVPVYDSFTQQQFVDRLVSFFSLEERKGHDKFDAKRFYMFKSLFRNFGDTFVPLFLDHLKRLAVDKQESSQRCAAEIITGLLRGSKHWNFQKMQSLREQLTVILRSALNSITSETLSDWGTCIATTSESRDPNKYFWLFELLMDIPVKEESASFLESSWLYMLLGALTQQEWRVSELLHRVYAYLEPRLSHSYQNVREKLGSLLSTIFMYDVPLDIPCLNLSPKREAFLASVLPQLSILDSSDECMDADLSPNCGDGTHNNLNHTIVESVERKNAINLFRTLCRFIIVSVTRTLYSAPPEIFQLLPKLCIMQSDTTDDELQNECKITIAVLGQALLRPCSITSAISTLKQIMTSSSWHARSAALSFLQVMVFSNLFTVMHNDSWCKDISHLVLQLLEDERVEVREAAAESLGGLLHCEFMKIDEQLLSSFKQKCKRKLKRIRTAQGGSAVPLVDPNELKERHAGVLGLCACVNAFPYDVPEFLPDVLVLLANHLHDPQPIQTTIKKTLSNFRRTHHDNWRDHKLKFTDDQLTIITDLLVSPSYYA